MATALSIPVRADARGRAKLVSGDEEAVQVIMTALSDCDSDHAFQQDLGLGSGMVFYPTDPTVRAKILQRLRLVFRDFLAANRFRLKEDTIVWSVDSAEQELILEFKFIDLESDEELTFKRPFTGAS